MGLLSRASKALASRDFGVARSFRDELERELAQRSSAIRAFPTNGPMGLTDDATKALPEWQAARAAYDEAFAVSRQFNPAFNKAFSAELKAADIDVARQVAQLAMQRGDISGAGVANAAREAGVRSVDVRRIATLAMDFVSA